MAMGQLDPARDRLNKLAQVASHQQAAQHALADLDRMAQRKAGGGTVGGAAAPKAAAPAPPARVPAPEQKKLADTDKGL